MILAPSRCIQTRIHPIITMNALLGSRFYSRAVERASALKEFCCAAFLVNPMLKRDKGDDVPHREDEKSLIHLSINDLIDFARRHLYLISIGPVITVSLAVIYLLFFAVPMFTAQGELLIDAKVPQLTNEQWTEAGIVLDNAQVESQMVFLKSIHLAKSVMDKLKLWDHTGVPPADTAASTPEESAAMLKAISSFQNSIDVDREGLSYVLRVSFTDPDPARSAAVSNAIMDAYIEDQLATRSTAARQGSEWLERRINDLRMMMNAASRKVQEFKARRDYSIGGQTPDVQAGPDKKNATSAEGLADTLDELESTAMTYRKMFESSLQAYTEAQQRQSYPVTNARVISRAFPPLKKSSPQRLRILLLAAVLGGLLGLGAALVREAYR